MSTYVCASECMYMQIYLSLSLIYFSHFNNITQSVPSKFTETQSLSKIDQVNK